MIYEFVFDDLILWAAFKSCASVFAMLDGV
jgi:hypothetical protein